MSFVQHGLLCSCCNDTALLTAVVVEIRRPKRFHGQLGPDKLMRKKENGAQPDYDRSFEV